MVDPLDAKHGAFYRLRTGDNLTVADACHIAVGIPGTHGIVVRSAAPALNTPQDKPHHPPRTRSPTRTGFLRQPTHPLPKARRPLKSAYIPAKTGRPFRGDPRAPIPAPEVCRGTDAPGIRRVVRRPFPTLRNKSPKHLPAHMSAMPSTSGPRPSAAFPLAYAAEGEISLPQRPAALMRRRSNPRWPRRPDQEDRSLRGRRLKSPFPHPHRSPSVGARPL